MFKNLQYNLIKHIRYNNRTRSLVKTNDKKADF